MPQWHSDNLIKLTFNLQLMKCCHTNLSALRDSKGSVVETAADEAKLCQTATWIERLPITTFQPIRACARPQLSQPVMSARRVLSVTGDLAVQILRLTVASSDVFPPLKSAAAGALHIAELTRVSL